MNKLLVGIATACTLLLFSAHTAPVSAWATSEGSVYAQGDMYGSLGLSVHYFGAYVAFDYGLHDCISIGAATGYNGYSNLSIRFHRLPIIARAAFHPFNLSAIADKIIIRNTIDVYAGLCSGWIFVWKRSDIANDNGGDFSIREYIGMRYHFSDRLSIFVEDCPGVAYIAGGISYQL
jgi:hypothetical protein